MLLHDAITSLTYALDRVCEDETSVADLPVDEMSDRWHAYEQHVAKTHLQSDIEQEESGGQHHHYVLVHTLHPSK